MDHGHMDTTAIQKAFHPLTHAVTHICVSLNSPFHLLHAVIVSGWLNGTW